MFQIKNSTRLALTIGFICMSLVWLALGLKLIPDPYEQQLDHQMSLTRTIACTVSSVAENNRLLELQKLIDQNVRLEPNIQSIGVRRSQNGVKLMSAGPHIEHWQSLTDKSTSVQQIAVDILCNGRKWGQLEIVFKANQGSWLASLVSFPLGLIGFLTSNLTLFAWWIFSRNSRLQDTTQIVPSRVRSALDAIGSGLVLVTPNGEIAHANQAFGNVVKRDPDELTGTNLSEFNFQAPAGHSPQLPWTRVQKTQRAVSGDILEISIDQRGLLKFMVNVTPIYGANNQSRGVLISFEDVTVLESKKAELAKILQTVRLSRDEVQRQNEQLNFLASYDPMTKCMNRRSFFSRYEKLWAEQPIVPLSICMVDIDHFKSVNDDHGHSKGDEVLISVGGLLNEVVGKQGTVCRYGGEEFAILMPNMDFDDCVAIAERVRQRIEAKPIGGLEITASLGVSGRAFGAMDPQHMLDQADQCLYIAKRGGRNQVVRFDQAPVEAEPTTELSEFAAKHPSRKNERPATPMRELAPTDTELSVANSLLLALTAATQEISTSSDKDLQQLLAVANEVIELCQTAVITQAGFVGQP